MPRERIRTAKKPSMRAKNVVASREKARTKNKTGERAISRPFSFYNFRKAELFLFQIVEALARMIVRVKKFVRPVRIRLAEIFAVKLLDLLVVV